MAHVHGAKAATDSVQAAKMAKDMTEAAKGGMSGMTHGMGSTAAGGMQMGTGDMGAMMQAQGMGPGAGQLMANMPAMTEGAGRAARGALAVGATGTAVSVTSKQVGKTFMNQLVRHPWVVFGLGVAAGYLIHKYRKQIIATATRVTETGKDFVLQQKENLEDLVSEVKESDEESKKTKG